MPLLPIVCEFFRFCSISMPPQMADASTVTTMLPEERKLKWAQFIAGHAFSLFTLAYEIATFGVCFEDDEDNEKTAKEVGTRMQQAWLFGVMGDLLSVIVLSTVYGSPVDANSAHKIPPEDTNRSCCSTCTIRFVAPVAWGLASAYVGFASFQFGDHPACDTNGGDWLDAYLKASGGLLVLFGFGFLVIFVGLLLPILAYCCKPARTCTSKVLATFPFIDLFWQIQSVIWTYRSGSIGLAEACTLGFLTGSGHYLAEIGSFVISVVPVARVVELVA